MKPTRNQKAFSIDAITRTRVLGHVADLILSEKTLLWNSPDGRTFRAVIPQIENACDKGFNELWERLAFDLFSRAAQNGVRGKLRFFSAVKVEWERARLKDGVFYLKLSIYFGNADKKTPPYRKVFFFDPTAFCFRKAPFLTKTQKKSILVAHFRKR